MPPSLLPEIDALLTEIESYMGSLVQEAVAFSAAQMAKSLANEAEKWNAPSKNDEIPWATEEEIPILDFSPYFTASTDLERQEELHKLATQLREVSCGSGFYFLKGHGVDENIMANCFAASKNYFAKPIEQKKEMAFDGEITPSGCGYLPVGNRKLPKRVKGNLVEAFVFKQMIVSDENRSLSLEDNVWPRLPEEEFEVPVRQYIESIENLSLSMLPVYAHALEMEETYFDEAFSSPMFRFRMSCYPDVQEYENQQFGIAPHVDTSFFTVLAQYKPGLVVFVESTQRWVRVPEVENCFVINTGQLLRQITNDTWTAAKHYALNSSNQGKRYSLPFFFNATADYKLPVIPSCTVTEPARYPPLSYLDGQAVVQGE